MSETGYKDVTLNLSPTATLSVQNGGVLSNFAFLEVPLAPPTDTTTSGYQSRVVLREKRRTKREHSLSEAFSRNITMILEDLLKDYDKTERPSFQKGKQSNSFSSNFLFVCTNLRACLFLRMGAGCKKDSIKGEK